MIYPNVFKEFGIQVKRCHKVRATYICETDKGMRAIRKSDYTPKQIVLQYRIKEHLVQNGFTQVDPLYLSRKDAPYVTQYDKIYVMTDWYNGPEVDFYNNGDIHQSVRMLAYMHLSGKDFISLPNESDEIRIKNLGNTYEKRYRETNKLRKKISMIGNKTDFELLYAKNVLVYKELQEMAIELMTTAKYEDLIQIAKKERTIAHHKYTYHNIIKTSEENLLITGFEKSGYDVQLTDLAYIIRRIMQKNNWDINLLSSIIETYNQIKPLSAEELKILKGMIIFPEKFSSLCNQYYNTKRRWNYNMFYRKLVNMIEYKDSQVLCAKKILEW